MNRVAAVAGHVNANQIPEDGAERTPVEGEAELRRSAEPFRASGVAFIPGLVDAAGADALGAALDAARAKAGPADALPTAGWRAPGFFDAAAVLEGGDQACVRVLESPRLAGLLQAAVGSDAHLVNLQGSLAGAPAGPTQPLRRETARDDGGGAMELGSFLHPVLSEGVKVFIALSDQDGDVTYAPGTFRNPDPPPANSEQIPGRVAWKAKKGDALLMCVRTWHSAAPRSPSLALYAQAFNKKPMAGVSQAAARLDSGGELSTLARQLLGLYAPGHEGGHMSSGAESITLHPPFPPSASFERTAEDVAATIPALDFAAGHDDAPQGVKAQAEHMRRWGYVRIKGFVPPERLARLQAAFRAEQAEVLRGLEFR
jgi:hypothetical protein